MKKLCILGLITVTLVGCATLKQAKDDVQTGYTAPLTQGETSVQEQAQQIGNNVSGVVTTAVPATTPFSIPLQAGVASIAGLFLAWQRGRSIRKNQTPSMNPVTGFLGNKAGLEMVVQNISTISQGITEVFKEGSSAQHAWQGLLTGLIGLAGMATMIQPLRMTLEAHPEFALYAGGASAAFAGLQQALTQVKPIIKPIGE